MTTYFVQFTSKGKPAYIRMDSIAAIHVTTYGTEIVLKKAKRDSLVVDESPEEAMIKIGRTGVTIYDEMSKLRR